MIFLFYSFIMRLIKLYLTELYHMNAKYNESNFISHLPLIKRKKLKKSETLIILFRSYEIDFVFSCDSLHRGLTVYSKLQDGFATVPRCTVSE